jgi:hypothetical protein
VTLLLAILAVYRVAFLIAYEEGPFALAERLRSWVVQRWGGKSWQGRGIACPLCISFWLAFLTAFPYTYFSCAWLASQDGYLYPPLVPVGIVLLFVLFWLGIAGGVMMCHRVYEKLGR